jgi:hypothetical protein
MFALLHSPKASRPDLELEALMIRIRHRLYPETIPVLASYWLKTVYAASHPRGWWKELNGHLKDVLREKEVLREPSLNTPAREALVEIQNWIQQRGLMTSDQPHTPPPRKEPFRANLRSEAVAPYLGRLLNEWLSAEVASLLVNETDLPAPNSGIPILAIGLALERLLVRERLSPETLEMFLQPGVLSPRYFYPADAEVLRDVVLALLGRTWTPGLPVLPAMVLGAATGSPLLGHLREAVCHASLIKDHGSERIHVPVPAQALEDLKSVPTPVKSIIVTMDGRWWESQDLDIAEQPSVVYKPVARLRIDYSAEHAGLVLPCPDTQMHWTGSVHLQDSFEIFGREWHASSWEADAGRTLQHLVFSRFLQVEEIQPAADMSLRRSHPAAVDIAWTALGDALTASITQKRRDPIEHLSREDFIPLGRALLGLVESMNNRLFPKRDTIDTQLRAVRYLQAEVSLEYGRVPWRILPEAVSAGFLKRRKDPDLRELLNQVFDGIPEELVHTIPSRAA